jgi:hypothetical protein
MHLSLIQTLALLGIMLAAGIVIKRLQGERRVKIPRMTGAARSNPAGLAISENRCPVCGDLDGFFHGAARSDGRAIIYCGAERCRASFLLENYGPGMAFAEPGEAAPDYLYGRRRARAGR